MSPALRNRALGLALAGAIYAADQYIKWFVKGPMRLWERQTIELLPFFDLTWAENRGISLGLFSANSTEAMWILLIVTGIVALMVTIWLLRERRLADILPLALVLGGALGNIRDRFHLGYVIDYADLHFGSFRPFLIFNLADAAISIGVAIILVRALFIREKPPYPHSGGEADPPAERS